ncbi:glycosyl hydrolase 115 family protein [Hymenobacter tibetensis]|uniref:Glycosyl hydrolase 115 family protein n=1 Tax=Hymenobacter tibetensis TaxID=497967 RepID=A0ABY4D131_9BACT|nr:glycosyl hydrolase 115 family protein [Hymenobacter tibetensis]UOG76225.1 glycosyl hydrolase 115 family protein [Hymenobacter tibetensis]
MKFLPFYTARFRTACCLWLVLLVPFVAQAQTPAKKLTDTYVSAEKGKNGFTLAASGQAAALYASNTDWPGVLRAAQDLQADVNRVTNVTPTLITDKAPAGKEVVLIGTIGKSPLIDGLVKAKKLDVSQVTGKWETFVLQVVEKPLPGVDRALVIAGSDKRGTIYGIYDLSQQIGVSPWYWWADVPTKPQKVLYVAVGQHTQGTPKVKYRGIFINDEAPALQNWSKEKFGGVNSKMYAHMFELILRLKGNYLWPAMWGNMFNVDDPQNPVLADEYGIVMGTSHHEPLTRAHEEWKHAGKGAWNYQTNATTLQEFWRGGMKRMGTRENIVSIGMRGDGDEPMSEDSNIALLEKIVADQRKIIAEETGKPAEQTPQLWALYKEVQDYYDKGMRVPDDVTLLLCDDNWGNIRKLPKIGEKPRAGGYGIYYHFDYVGGPRNYKWLNTNPLPRIWEQMHLAHEYGANQIWIVNVGDLKPMEFPISFFLDYAWNPDKISADQVDDYSREWAAKQFGAKYATGIADILAKYAKYNARRKPELLNADTYSLTNYREWETVVADYNRLLTQAEQINQQLPTEYRDAYYQLVLHPVQACANLNELYYTVALNREAAKNGQANTNELAEKAKGLYAKDAEITNRYHALAGGKWNHMMDQTHIGYTYWQQPEKNAMPAVQTSAQATTVAPATQATPPSKPQTKAAAGAGFQENDGYVSIEAEHYSKAVHGGSVKWQTIPDLGRTLSGVTTLPTTAASQMPAASSPHLQYRVELTGSGPVTVKAYLAPTLNFTGGQGLRYAVSFDDEAPQIVNLHTGLVADNGNRPWEKAVAESILIKESKHTVAKPGTHVLKFWRVDPGVVLEKLVVDLGGVKPSYLGPPESASGASTNPKNEKGSVGQW